MDIKEIKQTCVTQISKVREDMNMQARNQEGIVKGIHDRLNHLEQYSRKNNVRIYGLHESKDEDVFQTVSTSVFPKLPAEASFKLHDVDNMHRLGGAVASTQPRQIIIKFVTHHAKMNFLRQRKSLKGSGISLSDDLTAQNFKLLRELQTNSDVYQAWSWDSKMYVRNSADSRPKQVRQRTDILSQ